MTSGIRMYLHILLFTFVVHISQNFLKERRGQKSKVLLWIYHMLSFSNIRHSSANFSANSFGKDSPYFSPFLKNLQKPLNYCNLLISDVKKNSHIIDLNKQKINLKINSPVGVFYKHDQWRQCIEFFHKKSVYDGQKLDPNG